MTKWRAVAPIIGLLSLTLVGRAAAQQPPVPPQEQPPGSEVLTRGPVHEAFAEPVAIQAEAGLIAPTQPPPAIQERPPAERPQGDNYVWVPGYWSWDADRNDYIWVSACWRVAPPGMSWVPGYWNRVAGGWEWVPGFWARTGTQEIEYLPAPPASVDTAPPSAPPPDTVWVPGCWYWREGVYVHRPGYWLRQQPGWVWEPSHTRWTPRGYVFVEGHWDYALADRGVLFAPVYFPRTVYARVGFSFSPSIAIDIGLVVADLFTYPRYSHYYFGDYYDDAYVRVGIYPRFDCERNHTWYDPIYGYDRWQYGHGDPHWGDHQRQDYDHRRTDRSLRPPRTYREMVSRTARVPAPQQRRLAVAGPYRSVVERQPTPMRLERMTPETRQRVEREGTDSRRFGEERGKWEAPAAAPSGARPPEPSNHGTKSRGGGAEHAGPSNAPRDVRVTRPERVRIPAAPIADTRAPGSGNGKRALPAQPADEHRQPPEHGRGRSKSKGE